MGTANEWLRRAESMLTSAVAMETVNMLNNDKCYILQQAVEKAIKAVLVLYEIQVPRHHDIGRLLKLVDEVKEIPQSVDIETLSELSEFAVNLRYPGSSSYDEISQEEYKRYLDVARVAFIWIRNQVNNAV